ncbi:MAG: RIP metalloprotease RseP [SAR324 cluster bacterium]|nr:RIP metalloprotease RseP [SAR324 cluster bacterium]
MMTTILSFIIVLGFLVFIHEMGHYLAARHVGVRVETFSIGFPPKMWGKKVGDTEYILSWIPLGGYVRLFGQNMDDEDPQDPTNYAAKTIFQRFYILIAGPGVNLIFAFLFMPMVYMAGISIPKYFLEPAVISHVEQNGFAEKSGLQKGDEIVSVNGKSSRNWEEVNSHLTAVKSSEINLEIVRDGYSQTLTSRLDELRENGPGWTPKIAPVIGGFTENSSVQEAGLKIGDRILSINGIAVKEWRDISQIIQKSQTPVINKNSADASGTTQISDDNADPGSHPGIPVEIEAEHQGELSRVTITPTFNASTQTYLLGMKIEQSNRSYGLIESAKMGTERLVFITVMTFQFIGKMFAGQGSLDDLGGPLRIGMVIGDAVRTGLADVFFLMAVISLQLGVFNLLPIPVLDGGHIFFLGIEKLKGGPLSAAIRERTQMIGFALLMFFMIVVTYNDILLQWG